MDLLIPFLAVFALAFAIEGMVEYFIGTPMEKYLPAYNWTLMYVAFVVAGIGVWTYKLDLIAGWLHLSDTWTWFGLALSAAMIGRGSNWLHDFWRQFLVSAKPEAR